MTDLTGHDFEQTLDLIAQGYDRLWMLSRESEHVIDIANPGDCSVCNGEDTVVELDYSTRWNSLRAMNEDGIRVLQGDPDFETVAFFCYECDTPYQMPEGVFIDWD